MVRSGIAARSYSPNPANYKLLEEVGHGASATVYRAIYLPYNEVIAVKCLDLDRCNSNLDDIRREAQTMSLIDHPNVVKAYCSFVVERNLWVIMPFLAEGSCLHLMKIAHPDGFEEPAICTILKETLKALEYLHKHGHIHRDVKAGNILLDTNGVIKLADFGVTACMFDKGDRQRSRNTFVGTPCWMAPEVLQPDSGYDFKADIWSFGITALELAHGHAPFSKYPPMKVLLMTIQNAPPGLDYDRDKKFSKSFKEMVAMCLVKDKKKRPTAEKLLKHSFFKHAKPPELSVKKLFTDLPPLGDRVKTLQHRDAASLALKRMPSAEEEALSQSEYKRGVSAWNFDIEDLKAQASLIQDDDDLSEIREGDESVRSVSNHKDASDCGSWSPKTLSSSENASSGQSKVDDFLQTKVSGNKGKTLLENEIKEPGIEEKNVQVKHGPGIELGSIKSEEEAGQVKKKPQPPRLRLALSGPLMPKIAVGAPSSSEKIVVERSENGSLPAAGKVISNLQRAPSFSGPLSLSNRASGNSLSAPIKSSLGFKDSSEDKAKANLVQIKGRFSVTSENVDLVRDIPSSSILKQSQGSPLKKSASVGNWISDAKLMPSDHLPKDICNGTSPASLLLPHLQSLSQLTSIQQDLIMNILNSLQPNETNEAPYSGKTSPVPFSPRIPEDENIEAEFSEKERLLMKISELQSRIDGLTEELSAERLRHRELRQQLAGMSIREADDERAEGFP